MELSSRSFTVLVANDDDDGLHTRNLAHQWHSDGLLEEFAWVTPSDLTRADFGPASVMASVMGREEQLELMTLLGARPRSLIRIVVLHLLTHENSRAERLVDACNEIAELVSRAMPRQLNDALGQTSMRLLRINLLVPESDLLPQSPGLIERGWEINAIVSPEDRPDLDRMNIFVRRSVNLHGHGLAAAAAVGGLWKDSALGAFDSHESDSTTGGGELIVIRCQARIVVGDDRSQELAAKVAETVQSSHAGATFIVPWGVPADNARIIAENSVAKLLSGAEWAPQERRVEPLEKVQVPLGVMLRNWAVFQLQMPLAVLKFLFGLGQSMVEQSVTAVTVGRGAGEVGRIRPLSPDEAKQVAEFRMKTLSDELNPTRLRDEASRWGQACPAAWRELRELSIGLVDGSRLPDRFARTTRGGLDEVLTPTSVVPLPDDIFRTSGTGPVDLVDVEHVADLAQDLEKREADAASTSKGKAAGEPNVETARESGSVDAEPSELDRLTAWVEKRKPSLLWQLSTRVYEFRRSEEARAQAAEQALGSTNPPSTARLKTAQSLVVGSWLITLAGLCLLGLWAWAGSQNDPWAFIAQLPRLDWLTAAKVVLFIVLLLLVAGTFYFQALRAYEWGVAQRLHTFRQASDEYVAARQQEKRWALMYRGVQDWARILSEVLHRPWMTSPEEPEDLGKYAGLPAAVAVAVPVHVDEGPDPRVVTHGIEAVCQRGWLNEEFHRVVALSPSNDPAAQPHAGDLPADLDLGLRPRGPRSELAEVAASHGTKESATRELLRELTDLVSHGDVRMPPQTVVRLGEYSAGDQVVDREFFGASSQIESPLAKELFHDAALMDRYNVPERIVLSLPVGSEAPQLPHAEVNYCGVSVATRVDVSPLVQPEKITLFAHAHRAPDLDLTSVEDFN